jgi:phage gpG-like protein
MSNPNKVPDFSQMANELKKNVSRYAAGEAEKFFKDSFVKGGWSDTSFTAWKPSSTPMAGYRTLFKSGKLMRSIRRKEETLQRIVLENDLEYSEIHNEGGVITVTPQMKKFFWAKYYEFGGKKKGKNNAKSDFCKYMALKKAGSKIKIPKRQFMGESRTMMNIFETWFKGEIKVVFKQHLNE